MTAPPHASKKNGACDPDNTATAEDSPDAGLVARLQAEIEALRRENAELKQGEAERKWADKALSESEEKFMLALTNSPTVLFHQDNDLQYTWVYNFHPGFSGVRVLGKTDAELLPPEDAVQLTSIKRQVMATGIGTREEVRTTIDGIPYYYDLTVEPSTNEQGETVGVRGVSHDIIRRKRAEEERENVIHIIEGERALLQSVLEQLPEGVIIAESPSGKLLLANQRMKEI